MFNIQEAGEAPTSGPVLINLRRKEFLKIKTIQKLLN